MDGNEFMYDDVKLKRAVEVMMRHDPHMVWEVGLDTVDLVRFGISPFGVVDWDGKRKFAVRDFVNDRIVYTTMDPDCAQRYAKDMTERYYIEGSGAYEIADDVCLLCDNNLATSSLMLNTDCFIEALRKKIFIEIVNSSGGCVRTGFIALLAMQFCEGQLKEHPDENCADHQFIDRDDLCRVIEKHVKERLDDHGIPNEDGGM